MRHLKAPISKFLLSRLCFICTSGAGFVYVVRFIKTFCTSSFMIYSARIVHKPSIKCVNSESFSAVFSHVSHCFKVYWAFYGPCAAHNSRRCLRLKFSQKLFIQRSLQRKEELPNPVGIVDAGQIRCAEAPHDAAVKQTQQPADRSLINCWSMAVRRLSLKRSGLVLVRRRLNKAERGAASESETWDAWANLSLSLWCRSALKGPLPPSAPGNVERRGLSGAISKLSALFTLKERLMETLNEIKRERETKDYT